MCLLYLVFVLWCTYLFGDNWNIGPVLYLLFSYFIVFKLLFIFHISHVSFPCCKRKTVYLSKIVEGHSVFMCVSVCDISLWWEMFPFQPGLRFHYFSHALCQKHRSLLLGCLWNSILWLALFLWVPIFVDWTKMTHSWGSKFVAIVFSLIIHTENYHFMGTGIGGSDPPRKPRKLVPHEI